VTQSEVGDPEAVAEGEDVGLLDDVPVVAALAEQLDRYANGQVSVQDTAGLQGGGVLWKKSRFDTEGRKSPVPLS
jgi:hypothetical protein